MSGKHKKFKKDPSGTTTTVTSNLLPTIADSSLESSVVEDLPPEILIRIFKYLTHNELGRVARASKRWMECSRYPFLWTKVHVKLSSSAVSQTEVAINFFNSLPSCVTHLKLEFGLRCDVIMVEKLNFETFCAILKERCPDLQTLILNYAQLSVSLGSVINLCAEFLPNLLKLEFCSSDFHNRFDDKNTSHGSISKIEVLSICDCRMYEGGASILKMPYLKKLFLSKRDASIFDVYFWNNASLLGQLEVLHLQDIPINLSILQSLRLYASKLTELCMCRSRLPSPDYFFSDYNLFCLKEVCLVHCQNAIGAHIVSLIQSCSSLQIMYVQEELAQFLSENPSVVAGQCQLDALKGINECPHNQDLYE